MADGDYVTSLFDDETLEAVGSAKPPSVLPPPRFTFVCESFSEAYVREHDKILFNNNNNAQYGIDPTEPRRLMKLTEEQRKDAHMYQGGMPKDYTSVQMQCTTRNWIDHFHSHYRVVNIDAKKNLGWMKQAAQLACIQAGVSSTYREDLEDCARATDTGGAFDRCDPKDSSTGYFVRTDRVSLKDGIHGIGPYFSLKTILESAVTARGGHQGVSHKTQQVKFYLMPWLPNLDPFREFRIFVRNRRVTAISQQSLYNGNRILEAVAGLGHCEKATSNDDLLHIDKRTANSYQQRIITNWCQILVPYIETVVVPRISGVVSTASAKVVVPHRDATAVSPMRMEEVECTEEPVPCCELESFVLDIVLLGPPACTDAEKAQEIVTLMEDDEEGNEQERRFSECGGEMPDLCRPDLLKPYFIEINPFGFNQASGSSLFSWIHDYPVLYYGMEAEDSCTSTQAVAAPKSEKEATNDSEHRVIPVRFTRR